MFARFPEHVYKWRVYRDSAGCRAHWFCSWSCLQMARKTNGSRGKHGRAPKVIIGNWKRSIETEGEEDGAAQ